ncbi:MAG: hypothetical protein WB998_12595 [Solirubrobacteraceae bacterium]
MAINANGVISSLTRPVPTRPKYTQETETDWWACLNGVGRRWVIGRTTEIPNGGNTGGFGAFRIAGRYLTFEYRWGSRYGLAESGVKQYDLRTGRRTFTTKYWAGNAIVAEPVGSGASSLVVNAAGNAAWLLNVEEPQSLGIVSVIVHSRMGTLTLASYEVELANGAWASPVTGLAITQTSLSWRHDNEEQTAPVP